MKESLRKLYAQEFLNRAEAAASLETLASGTCSPVTVAAFLSALNMRPVSLQELLGFRDAMLTLALPVSIESESAIDVCGTGGDGKDTFNISTAASFVIAAAGIPVIKHGNYGVSSSCGSSNVLEALGVTFAQESSGLKEQLDAAGICFVHAPHFHPAMKHVAPVRRELGVKTFFNILGPLSNPAKPGIQLAGVYTYDLLRLYEQSFREIGTRFCVVHSLQGYDECSLTGTTAVITSRGSAVFSPEEVGLKTIAPESISAPSSIADSAGLIEQILAGQGTPEQESVVAVNAGLGMYAAEYAPSIQAGVVTAIDILRSGAAETVLRKVINAGGA